MSQKIRTTGIIGTIVGAVTLIVFFILTQQREPIDLVGLLFMLVAELVLFGGTIYVQRAAGRSGGTFTRAGAYSALAIYSVVAFVLCPVFILYFRESVKHFFVMQLVWLALLTIALILVMSAGRGAAARNRDLEHAVSSMNGLYTQAVALERAPEHAPFAPKLQQIAEALRFCDVSTAHAQDAQLAAALNRLDAALHEESESKADLVDEICNELLGSIGHRNQAVKSGKLGRV